jgi:ParB family chromosome partitioning protein
MKISDVMVGPRYRRELGDIASLAHSIAEVGLLHPIVVRPDRMLIAGRRRLAACQQLGWDEIPATEVDLDEILRGELAENVARKDFLPTEIDAIRRALEPLERAAAAKRMTLGKISIGSKTGTVRDRIGAWSVFPASSSTRSRMSSKPPRKNRNATAIWSLRWMTAAASTAFSGGSK